MALRSPHGCATVTPAAEIPSWFSPRSRATLQTRGFVRSLLRPFGDGHLGDVGSIEMKDDAPGRVAPVEEHCSSIRGFFAMVLAGQPDEAHLHAGLAKHDQMKERYPRKQELRAAMIPFDPTKLSSTDRAPGAGTLMGFSFDSLKPDGQVERAVSYRDGALSIMRTECGDWSLLQEEVSEEFDLLLPALGRDVEALTHERVDRFFWPEPRDAFRAAELFRQGSRWLVPNVVGTTSAMGRDGRSVRSARSIRGSCERARLPLQSLRWRDFAPDGVGSSMGPWPPRRRAGPTPV